MTHRITVLYFTGCPNHSPVVEMAQRLIAEHNLDAIVEEVELTDPADAERLRFLGSPTVQVDGVDIEQAARTRTDYAMSCRVYQTPGGVPTEAMLLDALGVSDSAALGKETDAMDNSEKNVDRAGAVATIGSALTAVLSSTCCWLPLMLIAFGVSAGGVGAFFARWRPYFAAVSLVFLGAGFYFAYIRAPKCEGSCCSPRARRQLKINRAMLWVSSAIVLAFVLFPHYGGWLIETVGGDSTNTAMLTSTDADPETHASLVFNVQGMTCEVCAVSLKKKIANISGVNAVRVDYPTKTASVWTDKQSASTDEVASSVAQAADHLGFSVERMPDEDASQ